MNQDDATARLWKIIKGTRFAMLTHRHGNGRLHSQPLTTQNEELGADSTLYFFVGRDGDVAARAAGDAQVNVAYANVDDDDYASISGRAFISEDAALKKALFDTQVKAWFPGGLEDPNLALLGVRIEQAELWEAKDSKLVQLVKMATSAVTGKVPTDMTDHRKLGTP